MSLPVVVDMNLSVEWVVLLREAGWEAVPWVEVGDPRALDATIMRWAASHGHVVLTHDLDFGMLLALTGAGGPSVVQVRSREVLPEQMGPFVLAALEQCREELASGALVVVEPTRRRVRILPLSE